MGDVFNVNLNDFELLVKHVKLQRMQRVAKPSRASVGWSGVGAGVDGA